MKKIFIYSGPGVCRQSFTYLTALFSPRFSVEMIDPSRIIRGNWMEGTALIAFPGGADLPYCRALNGLGNQHIRSFVEWGGLFLGICAGSYYAGSFVEFAKGTDLEVVGERELAFFPGTVEGPTFGPFQYGSTIGSRIVQLSTGLLDGAAVSFYQGGGHFSDCEAKSNVRVLGRYMEAKGEPAAVILCSIGKGYALLSGVHFEYPLERDDGIRLRFIKKCFELVGLQV